MDIERQALRLAERQYGVVANRQIRELGGDRFFILRRVNVERWERATSSSSVHVIEAATIRVSQVKTAAGRTWPDPENSRVALP